MTSNAQKREPALSSVRVNITLLGGTVAMSGVAGLVADGPHSQFNTFALRCFVTSRGKGGATASPWAFSVVPAVSPSTLRALYGMADRLAETGKRDGKYEIPWAGSRYVLPRLHGRVDCEQTVPIDVEDGAAVYEVSTRGGVEGEPWRELLAECHIDPDGGEPFTQTLDDGDAVPEDAFYGWVAEHAKAVSNFRNY